MWFFVFLIYIFVCAVFSSLVAEAKGYSKKSWFWMGILCGIFTLIAAAGMPNLSEQVENMKLLKELEQAPKTFIYKVKQ